MSRDAVRENEDRCGRVLAGGMLSSSYWPSCNRKKGHEGGCYWTGRIPSGTTVFTSIGSTYMGTTRPRE